MAVDSPSFTVTELQQAGILRVEDGNHGENRPRPDEFGPDGVAFIRAADMQDGRVSFESADHINAAALARITKGIGCPGDTLLSHKGTIGKVALVPDDAPAFVCSPQTTFWRTCDQERLDRRYLHAFLRSPGFRVQLATRAGETDMAPYVSLTSQRGLRVSLPPIDEQRAIASVLGAFDDKIELNRRMNETLEALARAIFNSWFVDLDPVRAKAKGRQPIGMDAETASLFPDSFEDSPLGPIPCGWQVVRLGTQIDVVRGLSYSGAGLTDADGGGVPLHNLNSIFEGGGYKHEGIKWYTGEYQERHVVAPGDLIVANTEQGFGQLLIGFPAIVPARYGNISLFSHHLYHVRPKLESALTTLYLYLLLSTARYHAEVAGFANGTTINMLPIDALTRPWIALPPKLVVERFDALILPMLARQEQARAESDSLAQARDALLPKLVSGEIRPRLVDG